MSKHHALDLLLPLVAENYIGRKLYGPAVRQRERGEALRGTACTIYTVPQTMINIH
jgi:hypothetical protein